MGKRIKFISSLLIVTIISCFLTGCSLQDKIDEYASDKEQCYLNSEDVTQFIYKKKNYTILEDTVSDRELGDWVGYFRQLVVVDETGKILYQEETKTNIIDSLKDMPDNIASESYVIPFLNIYTNTKDDNSLIVEVNGEYHKAIFNKNVKDMDKIFDFKTLNQSISDKFEVNPENTTQLIYGKRIHQITTEIISKNELGNYIDVLAENIVFDAITKIPLSDKELGEIDWSGNESNHQREQWIYKDIYEIKNIDKNEAIAVMINNQYYVARHQ